jgi:formate dehydrogenase gamma subunit
VPGGALGNQSDSELWRMIRQGTQGNVSIPDKKAGILIQSEGETWRALRNGPLSTAGIWVMLGMVVLLALFFALRGRIKIEHGRSGQLVERFNLIERIGHWLTAVSFIILAITGLNILYGRYVLPQVIGKEAFSTISQAGKWVHDYVAFAFMAGLVMIFVLWVVHNLPSRHDLIWLAKGGGLFTKGSHPSSRKFNAGQKIIFWVTILGGLSLSLSGWALLDPFQYAMFAKTFQFLNIFGFNLPTEITLARGHLVVHDRGDTRPHLYRLDGHGRRLRRHGLRQGRRELGPGASRPVARGGRKGRGGRGRQGARGISNETTEAPQCQALGAGWAGVCVSWHPCSCGPPPGHGPISSASRSAISSFPPTERWRSPAASTIR